MRWKRKQMQKIFHNTNHQGKNRIPIIPVEFHTMELPENYTMEDVQKLRDENALQFFGQIMKPYFEDVNLYGPPNSDYSPSTTNFPLQKRRCAECGNILHEDSPEDIEIMRKEYEQNFGCKMPDSSMVAEVCDDCYQQLKQNENKLKDTDPDKHAEIMVEVYADAKRMEPK